MYLKGIVAEGEGSGVLMMTSSDKTVVSGKIMFIDWLLTTVMDDVRTHNSSNTLNHLVMLNMHTQLYE